MENTELLQSKIEELKTAWTLENTEVSDKLRAVEKLVESGDYSENELKAALSAVRVVIESVEPRVTKL